MADEILSAYSALYARIETADRDASVARARLDANPGLMAAKVAPLDPRGFRKALDALIPKVQAAFDAALKAHDYDRSENIEGFLTRLYFWRIFARDQLVATLDADGTDEAMAALGRAAARLRETRDAVDEGDTSTAVAAESLDELAGAIGVKA